MTRKQIYLYWTEWRGVKKVLAQKMYMEPKEAEGYRHTLHVKALGYDKSSKEFTNAEFDKILATFRAYTRPADLDGQLRQLEQPKIRAAHALQRLVTRLNLTPEYVDGMALKICKKKVSRCDEKDLPKLIAALTFHAQRVAKKCLSDTHQEPVSTL